MKTFWKTPLTHTVARQKQIAFEQKTGVKWDWYSSHGGTAFTPIVTKNTPINEDAARVLLSHLTKDYTGFVALSERSGMTLQMVLSGAKTLVYSQRAVATVNRMGNFAAIRKP